MGYDWPLNNFFLPLVFDFKQKVHLSFFSFETHTLLFRILPR